ncbi:LPS assembly lipoprotein LptE [Aminobacter aganoensis]|uniref:LPS-assembly lipoprotein n=1 Tax=Aminobacter aganoensis TaxID=83264 RepID=A0A7X0KLY9_9HYPH|nr:LPS assembly lipoprotein LptE [Aminobacter aganoensis]MBB6355528.1 LPS-assembly lipoprotein [Aminobacter aganoensis]
MSLPDARNSAGPVRVAARLAFLASLALASACTVRPLYSDGPVSAGVEAGTATQLASINIKPINTRYGQEVRNHLIFMFNGGAGQQATAPYTMDLAVAALTEASLLAEVTSKDDEPTAGAVTLTGTYVITDVKTGKRIAAGKRNVSASFDRPRQEFARMRAERDAENRAARELAELLRLAIAQDMSRG